MKDLKAQLVKLGEEKPKLRPHLTAVLDTLNSREAATDYSHLPWWNFLLAQTHEFNGYIADALAERINRVGKGQAQVPAIRNTVDFSLPSGAKEGKVYDGKISLYLKPGADGLVSGTVEVSWWLSIKVSVSLGRRETPQDAAEKILEAIRSRLNKHLEDWPL